MAGEAERLLEDGERKQVTVLFVNAHGSLDLGLALDPEDWHRILSRFFAILDAAVVRFGGVIDRFTGEGIKARFGAPIAHENHAQQACRAALHLAQELQLFSQELRRSAGINFSFRMGLNSGEVLFGPIGDDLGFHYSAQGPTAALAARMEQLAEPGKVYLTASTAALVRHQFRLRDLGSFNVKGVAQPLRTYELEGATAESRDAAAASGRSRTPFVGRRRELAFLEAALERVMASGQSQVVGVVGEPGVGKTRLCEEIVRICEARGFEVQMVRTNENPPSPRQRLGVPFLRQQFGLAECDSPQSAREKIAGRLALLEASLLECLPAVFELFGIADGAEPEERAAPDAHIGQLARVLQHLLASPDPRTPHVVVCDDRQWAHPLGEAVIRRLLEVGLPNGRLVISAYRTGYRPPAADQPNFEELALGPLCDTEADALLASLLGSHVSLRDLTQQIRERAAGNPFFLEEVVRELVESGALVGEARDYRINGDVAPQWVPASLQAVLAARIDRLPERERAILGIASVIGLRFADGLLARVSGLAPEALHTALAALETAHILQRGGTPESPEHDFRHPLLRDTAYRSLLRATRTRLHATIARELCALHDGALDEHAALLAHHWSCAGHLLEAARWYRRAAESVDRKHPQEALEHWRQIRALLSGEEDAPDAAATRIAACTEVLRLACHQGPSADESEACYAEGVRLARQVGDTRSLALLTALYGDLRGMLGTAAEAVAHSEHALELARGIADARLQAKLGARLAVSRYVAGDLRATLDLTAPSPSRDAAPDTAAPQRSSFVATPMALLHAMALLASGELVLGRTQLDHALAESRRLDDPSLIVWALGCYPLLVSLTGDATGQAGAEASCCASEALQLAESLNSNASRAAAYRAVGLANLLERRFSDAAVALERAKQIILSRQTSFHLDASLLSSLAEAYRGQGRIPLSCETAREAVALAQRRGTRVAEIDAQLSLARALYLAERYTPNPEIDAAVDAAFALIAPTGARSREPQLRVALAKIARMRGDEERYCTELRRAYAEFLAIGASGHAARTARLLR